jgi:hypothetical protein
VLWGWTVGTALALVLAGALYARLRWRKSPLAYRAMMELAVAYFVAGAFAGAWLMHVTLPGPVAKPPEVQTGPAVLATPVASAPMIHPGAEVPSSVPFVPPALHYDPARAILPDPKLTPGDTFPGVTADDVCTPGWSRAHRDVTEAMRDQVYAEYGRTRAPGCCEVDHLIPLELGGSNDMKNLWPQPDDPHPGDAEKDQLENDLHKRVCEGKMPLVDAQKCIASNWVECWKTYVVPEYGPAWAAENRRGW